MKKLSDESAKIAQIRAANFQLLISAAIPAHNGRIVILVEQRKQTKLQVTTS